MSRASHVLVTPAATAEEDAVLRHDDALDVRTSRGQGMRRLPIIESVQLRPGDEITLVVPSTAASDLSKAGKATRHLISLFERVIVSSLPHHFRGSLQKREYLQREFCKRTVIQAGKECAEFNVRVANYPERPILALQRPLDNDTNHRLEAGRAGLNVLLIGYRLSNRVLLKLSLLLYVQVFKRRNATRMLHLWAACLTSFQC